MQELNNDIKLLHQAFCFKYNSIAAYILKAEPFYTATQQSLLFTIGKIAEKDKELCQQILIMFNDLDIVPRIEPYPPEVSELNYLSLDYLKRVLISSLEHEIAVYSDGSRACVDPKIFKIVQDLIEVAKRQIKLLTEEKGG